MIGDSSVQESSGDAAAAVAVAAGALERSEGGGVGSNSGEEDKGIIRGDEGDRSFGGNRWPRQETLALLKIRLDMDTAFRDSSLKGPLWEEVSRKLAELGYNRSAKKCKEKFENVYKYHKRTKEGRTGKQDGKTYKFFDQLQALETHPPSNIPSTPSPKPQTQTNPMTTTAAAILPWTNPPSTLSHVTVPSTTNPTNLSHTIIITPTPNPTIPSLLPVPNPIQPINPSQNQGTAVPSSFPNNFSANLFSSSTSSSTASDGDHQFEERHKRKRKWKDFFTRLTKEVIHKQEELQKKFLDTIEKREHERMAREEAWRIQEMARLSREHEILVQERSTAAAKDAAVIAFLQKISGQQHNLVLQTHENPQPPPPPHPAALPPQPQPQLQPRPPPPPPPSVVNLHTVPKMDNGENVVTPGSSRSRWPKAEVQALIKLRTSLDLKYPDNGPKGPLWEEISTSMRNLGYSRSAKRCKEKWENINKYFKKVKESNKKRPEDSKTCPYFHQLDAIYREKNKINNDPMVPLMVQPESQWPLQQENQPESITEDIERENMDHIQEDIDDQDGDSEEEDEGNGYEIVANKPATIGTAE